MISSGKERKYSMGGDVGEPARRLNVFSLLIWVRFTWT